MNDWKKKASDRRDERSVKSPDDTSQYPKPSKNKRKWCRGKVGVEHQPKCNDYPGIKNGKLLICEQCSKQLDLYIPLGSTKLPEWVK